MLLAQTPPIKKLRYPVQKNPCLLCQKEAHLEVFQQDIREVGPLDKPAVWDNLSLQPLDHAAPQLIAVSSVAHHCRNRDGFNSTEFINKPKDKTLPCFTDSNLNINTDVN